MSNPITPLDSFWASLEQLALLVEDFPHFSENPPSLPPRATTAHPRRTRPIEKIDWEKYSDGLLNEYGVVAAKLPKRQT